MSMHRRDCSINYILFRSVSLFFMILIHSLLSGKVLEILEDGPVYDTLGFDSNNLWNDGESDCIKYLIKNLDIVFDVGANIGDWSAAVLMAHSRVTIFAFEPVPELAERLLKRFGNKLVHVNQIALSNQKKKSTFNYYPSAMAGGSFFEHVYLKDVPRIKFEVDTLTLDEFCGQYFIDHVNFLKIDTEGTELNILLGARKLLEENEIDIIQFEYGGAYPAAKATFKQVFQFLRSFGYVVFRIFKNNLVHIEQWRDALENYKCTNYLAMTKSCYTQFIRTL